MLVWTVPVALHVAGRIADRMGREGAANRCARLEDETAQTALMIGEAGIVAVLVALAVMQ